MSGKAWLLPFFTKKQSRNENSFFTWSSFTIMHYLFVRIICKLYTHTHICIRYIICNTSLYYIHINHIHGFQGTVSGDTLISTTAWKDVVARGILASSLRPSDRIRGSAVPREIWTGQNQKDFFHQKSGEALEWFVWRSSGVTILHLEVLKKWQGIGHLVLWSSWQGDYQSPLSHIGLNDLWGLFQT